MPCRGPAHIGVKSERSHRFLRCLLIKISELMGEMKVSALLEKPCSRLNGFVSDG
jgi:hypothetical protein